MFDQLPLSLDALLDRYQCIDESGKYVSKIDPAVRFGRTLGALSGGRVNIVQLAVGIAKDALLVSIRYSAARRQFGPPSSPEAEVTEIDVVCALFFF